MAVEAHISRPGIASAVNPRLGRSLARDLAASVTAAVALGYAVAASGSYGVPPSLIVAAAVGAAAIPALVILCIARPIDVLLISWVLFVVQEPLRAYASYVSHSAGVFAGRIDDVVLLILACSVFLRHLSRPRSFNAFPAVAIAAVLGIVGVASAVLRGDVGAWTLVGGWLSLKFWVVLGLTLAMPWRPADVGRVTKYVLATGVVVALLGGLDYASPGFLHHVLHTTSVDFDAPDRARSHAVQSVFTSPSRYSNFMSLAVAVALAKWAVTRSRSSLLLGFALALAGVASLRLRGVLALIAAAAVVILVTRYRRPGRIVQLGLMITVVVVTLGAAPFVEQLSKFTSHTEQTARGQLYANAFALAAEDFPLGTGFGRYGSYASVLYYSPYYEDLGMEQKYGFSRDHPQYLTDTSWSSYLAETGYAGTALLLGALLYLGSRLRRLARSATHAERTAAVAALAVLAAVLVMSVGSAALLDSVLIVALAMYSGCALARQRRSAADI